MKQHHAVTKYAVAKTPNGTFTVVYAGRENLSHHETLGEARAAIVRYEAADARRATKKPIDNSFAGPGTPDYRDVGWSE